MTGECEYLFRKGIQAVGFGFALPFSLHTWSIRFVCWWLAGKLHQVLEVGFGNAVHMLKRRRAKEVQSLQNLIQLVFGAKAIFDFAEHEVFSCQAKHCEGGRLGTALLSLGEAKSPNMAAECYRLRHQH